MVWNLSAFSIRLFSNSYQKRMREWLVVWKREKWAEYMPEAMHRGLTRLFSLVPMRQMGEQINEASS